MRPDQRMADDIGGGEATDGDAVDAVQHTQRLVETRHLAARQVALRRVAGDRHARAFAEAGEEHAHLHRRGVLRLVEDDEAVGQGAAAHEGERAISMSPTSMRRCTSLPGMHVVQRVVERTEIGIDLLLQIARQEAEALARFDRRAREDDALPPGRWQRKEAAAATAR